MIPTMYMVYDTQQDMQDNINNIDLAMGFSGDITTTWAIGKIRKDGKFVFPEPPMGWEGNKEEYNETWF